MSQTTQKGRSRKKGVSPMERWRKTKGFWAFLLAFSIAFTNMGSSAINAIAGSEMEREEFRLHVEDIRKAAEEAIENDEPIGEDFFQINGSDQNLVEDYEKLLDADGTLFEIFPEIETVKGTGSIELRVFLRIAEDGDPASYALTGEEELVFLYVNGNDEPAAARLNIDGYQTGFATVRPFETALEIGTPQVITGGGSGSSSGTGSDVSEPMYSGENGSNEAEENVTESAAEMNGSEAMDSLAAEESAAEGKNEEENAKPPAETAADDSAPVEESEPGENQQEQGEVILPEETLPASTEGMEETEEIAEPETEAEPEIQPEEDDAAEEGAEASEEESAVQGEDEIDSNQEEASVQEEQKEDEGEEVENIQLSRSRNQVASVMVSLASSSQAEKDKDSDEEADEEEYAEDDKDKDELSPEDEIFEKKGYLDGKLYNAVSLNETVTARAYVISLEEIGANAEELIEGAHLITYSFEPVGTAELIQAPELVRDEAQVTFGIRPQVGYSIIQATANGQELEQAEGSVVASRSEALRARIASPSDALSTEDQDGEIEENDIIYYTIPSVLEDQEVQIVMVESANGSHPAFYQEKTVNGVTVTVEAREGILPAGAELTVEEVTEQVEPAVRAKMEGEMEAAISLDDEEASEENADDQTDEETGEEAEEASNITAVLAYDINLMLNGKKLNNTWGDSNYVTVRFSGDRIQEASKEADKIEIAALETPTETVEAALGGTEEMPVVDHLTADNIELNTEGRQAIEISGDEGVREIEAEVSHFTVYTITFSQVNNSVQVLFETPADGVIWDEETDFREIELGSLNIRDKSIEITSGTGGSSDRSPIEMVVSNILSSDTVRNQLKNYYFAFAYIKIEGTRYEVETIYYNNNAIRCKYMVDGESQNMVLASAGSVANKKLHFVFVPDDMAVVYFHAGYHEGNEERAYFPTEGGEIIEVPIDGSNTEPHIEDIPENPVLDGAEFNGWVYKDAQFNANTLVCAGAHIYALYKTDNSAYKKNQEFKTDQDNAGQVNVSKDATWIDYEEGIGRIDLSVSGIPKSGTDVIIILDKSGSMSSRLSGQNFPERMVAARNAARAVRDAFLTEGSRNRVAYIPFSSGESILKEEKPYDPLNHTESYVGFQTYDTENTHRYLEKAINATDAYGGTSYHDALLEAKDLLDSRGNDKNENAVVIFMSDGAPNNKYDYVENETDESRLKESIKNAPEQDPIAAADLLKEDSVVIYSVGIQIDNNQKAINAMKMVSSNYYDEKEIADEYYYSVDDLSKLESVLLDIASELQLAGTKAVLTDTLADQFELLKDGEIQELQSSGIAVDNNGIVTEDEYSLNTGGENISISFTVGDITAVPQKYQIYIRIKDEFLTPSEGQQLYYTNKSVELNYKDINERDAKKTIQDFGEPRLDRYGTQISFMKKLVGSGSPDYSNVQFNLYRADAQGNFNSADDYLVQGVTFTQNAGLFTSSAPIGVSNDGTAVYYLKEVSSAPGYNILPDPIKLVLNVDPKGVYINGGYPEAGDGMLGTLDSTLGLSMEMTGDASGDYLKHEAGDGKNIWTINNYSAPKLPETGGPGLGLIKEFGWMLLLLAAMMAGVEVQMNRRRRSGR